MFSEGNLTAQQLTVKISAPAILATTLPANISNMEDIAPDTQPRMKAPLPAADPRNTALNSPRASFDQAAETSLPSALAGSVCMPLQSANFSMNSRKFARKFVPPGTLELPISSVTTAKSPAHPASAMQQMFEKIEKGDPSFIACLPAGGPSRQAFLDAIDTESEHTPLTLAIAKGHTSIAERLLNAGANCQVVNARGYNALSAAARFGQHELTLRLLREFMANGTPRKKIVAYLDDYLHVQDTKTQHTFLTLAITQGDDELVEFLLTAKLFSTYRGALGRDAITTAVCEGNAFSISKLWKLKRCSRTELVMLMRNAIGSAAKEGRSTLIIQLLAMYRELLQQPHADISEAEAQKHQQQKAEAYDFALHGNQATGALSIASAMKRSTDHLQLNDAEISELGLEYALYSAKGKHARAEQVLRANGVSLPEERTS